MLFARIISTSIWSGGGISIFIQANYYNFAKIKIYIDIKYQTDIINIIYIKIIKKLCKKLCEVILCKISLEREATKYFILALAGATFILALVICFAKIKYYPFLMSYIIIECFLRNIFLYIKLYNHSYN